MAAKENQGLQAAVIAFFILTVLLAVTTYLGYSSAQAEGARANKNKEDGDQARTALNKTQGDYNTLKRFVGFPETEEAAAIQAAYEKDMQEHAVLNLPEAERTYRKLVENLDKANKEKETQLAQAKRDMDKYTAETTTTINSLKESLAKTEEALQKTATDLAEERSKFTTDRNALTAHREKLQAELGKATEELAARQAEFTAASEKLRKEMNFLAEQNKGFKTQIREQTATSFEVPDGKITMVAQRGNMAYLNIGSRSGLRNKVTFSVYNPDQVNVENAKAKAKIEVIGTPAANHAEARIIEQDYSDPVVPGDVIYSPIWHHGQPQHFALAGVIDLDNDGVSDRKRVLDLIRLNGGIVDAHADDAGKVVGQITSSTKYLIVGEVPEVRATGTVDSSIEADLKAVSELTAQAQNAGVDQISLQKFLDNVGYASTIHPRGRSIEEERAPGRPAADGNDSAFRPRQPPARGAAGGAF